MKDRTKIGVAVALMAALGAVALIGPAGAGPGDPVTNKGLKKRSGAKSTFHDASIAVYDGAITDAAAVVGSLALPKGRYVIIAKTDPDVPPADTLSCRLNAGADFDEATVTEGVMVLTVAHKFGNSGSAVLRCSDVAGTVTIADTKITGMRFPGLKNTPF